MRRTSVAIWILGLQSCLLYWIGVLDIHLTKRELLIARISAVFLIDNKVAV